MSCKCFTSDKVTSPQENIHRTEDGIESLCGKPVTTALTEEQANKPGLRGNFKCECGMCLVLEDKPEGMREIERVCYTEIPKIRPAYLEGGDLSMVREFKKFRGSGPTSGYSSDISDWHSETEKLWLYWKNGYYACVTETVNLIAKLQQEGEE